MTHFVVIDDCFPINTRNRKIIQSLKEYYSDARISVIVWDRNQVFTGCDEEYCVYAQASECGNKFDKLKKMFGFRTFCQSEIKRLNPDVVIASHWNNLVIVPKLRDDQMLIYENLDVPTEGWLVRKITTWLEHRAMQHATLTVHASRFFEKLYSKRHKQIVLENKPTFNVEPNEYSANKPLRVSFIGGIRYPDILCNLIDTLASDKRFQLNFHGDGHALATIKEHAKGADNVSFTGYYEYKDIEGFYRNTDIIWAAYPNKDFNVKYAISNKFHESLAFGVPAIYSCDTELGEYVNKENIGFEVNPYSVADIRKLFEDIVSGKYDLKGMHSNMIEMRKTFSTWDDDFRILTDSIDEFIRTRRQG